MTTEKIISELVRPLVLSGAYKDEAVALKDIVVTHIEKKIENYKNTVHILQKKHMKDFGNVEKRRPLS